MRLKTGRPLNTGAALDYVTRNVFNPSAGSRGGTGASQILVLITAGKSRDDVGQAAATMKHAGIVPFAIGAKNADTAELQRIVSNPDSVLKLGDFNELQTIQEEFLTKVTAVSVIEEPIPPTEVNGDEMLVCINLGMVEGLVQNQLKVHSCLILLEDIIKLDWVQKIFNKLLPGMEGLTYQNRLERLGLFSLEHRRLRGDLIDVYEIKRGMDK
eukprot:g39331.t1